MSLAVSGLSSSNSTVQAQAEVLLKGPAAAMGRGGPAMVLKIEAQHAQRP